MDLTRSALAEQLDHVRSRGATNDAIVHDNQPLAPDHGRHRVELPPYAEVSDVLVWLDEGTPDVTILDQPLAEWDA